MPTRVAINGFGRIGRSFVRSAYERGADLEIVAINDIADPRPSPICFTYDSVYGQFGPEVSCDGNVIAFDGREIRVLGERTPADLPWADLDVDVVIEATGASAPAPTPSSTCARARARSSSRRRARAPSRSTPTSSSA
jgi:glyceraldehyde 3-phosphate dehydrogenase